MDNDSSSLRSIENSEKKVQVLQYVNTAILTFIGTVAMIIFIVVTNVRREQIQFQNQMIRFQVMQDHNTVQIDEVDARVKILEITKLEEIKVWIDANYIRKAQK
jgi:hypothetical protein